MCKLIYGTGAYRYQSIAGWGEEAKKCWNIKEIAGITVDAQDRIYLLTRTVPPVVVMDSEGHILEQFGGDIFVRAHGMHIDRFGAVYGVDDGGHAVYQFNEHKQLVRTLGTRTVPSDTGCVGKDYKTITQAAGPFHFPTRLTTDSQGCLYITDGYGNARVHKFDRNGVLLKSWGSPGIGPGQFNLPHGIAIDQSGILYVADRQNHRIQRFSTEGEYLSSWEGFYRPSDIWITVDNIIYVAECKRTSEWTDAPSRVSILDSTGKLLSRLEKEGCLYDAELGSRCAHGICVDSKGDLYVAEVGKKLQDHFFGVRKYRLIRTNK